ncbi:glycoside hydrolase family 16 protein [Polychaeton citri CBS 116435]|uniref:chitinase n=1 Tax=Polychaeton citri CBS 116435 TaxID=1314669 RepID=A0A9P4QCZ6_9PEZI|nr:glycoside hydrolase family 16 protein [Polychaeton citri CBS 116435]
MKYSTFFAASALLVSHTVTAQTYTDCNPLNSTCPANPALGTTFEDVYNSSQVELNPNFYNISAGKTLMQFSDDGMDMQIIKSGDSVTASTSFYIFWGQVEIIMKAAQGAGIISTMILISQDLDEWDWEIIGNNNTHVSTNYYGHGNRTQNFAEYIPVTNPQDEFHNYTINYQREQTQFMLDGQVVRTIPYAPSGQYPQTPCTVRFGIWAAGDPNFNPPGTVTWAGGETHYNDGPFVATVKSIKVVDGSLNSSSYVYGDETGGYESIKINAGESSAYQTLHKDSKLDRAQQHWHALSTGAKIGIAVGFSSAFGIAFIAFLFYCIKQRREGKQERIAADKEWEAEKNEMMAYRQRMSKGGFAVSHLPIGSHYDLPEGQRL